jgi:hypothetical protein
VPSSATATRSVKKEGAAMPLGSYSIIRYTNNVNDQRVNIGVLLWHPHEGFKYRVGDVSRVQAIDPRILVRPLKSQISAITGELDGAVSGPGTLWFEHLASVYREGLEISQPYPARIQSADETLENLYRMLVMPAPEIRRASSQRQYFGRVKKTLALLTRLHAVTLDDIGVKKVNGLSVNVGIRTSSRQTQALWHALSLQAEDNPDKQLALAKATTADIDWLRKSPDYRGNRHFVALEPPKPAAMEGFKDCVSWIKRLSDYSVIEGKDSIESAFERVFAA